jgi:hypothetical protein
VDLRRRPTQDRMTHHTRPTSARRH